MADENTNTTDVLSMDPITARKAAGMIYKMMDLMRQLADVGMDFCGMMEGRCDSCPIMCASGFDMDYKPENCAFNIFAMPSVDVARRQAEDAIVGLRMMYADDVWAGPWNNMAFGEMDTIKSLVVLPDKAATFHDGALVYKLEIWNKGYAAFYDESVAHFIHVQSGGYLGLNDGCIIDALVVEDNGKLGLDGTDMNINTIYVAKGAVIENFDDLKLCAREVIVDYKPEQYKEILKKEKAFHDEWEQIFKLRTRKDKALCQENLSSQRGLTRASATAPAQPQSTSQEAVTIPSAEEDSQPTS